ncbi:hypothetical protein RRG08_062803 [Elysia crispata]|uniref:Uncharacterized protein n=1 Tax=Elysia crispata TaxID=231223 RepID=A0AAE1A0S8_9GAST|nr:hypothetical protein RRG08_062803 [Elysia crispata]
MYAIVICLRNHLVASNRKSQTELWATKKSIEKNSLSDEHASNSQQQRGRARSKSKLSVAKGQGTKATLVTKKKASPTVSRQDICSGSISTAAATSDTSPQQQFRQQQQPQFQQLQNQTTSTVQSSPTFTACNDLSIWSSGRRPSTLMKSSSDGCRHDLSWTREKICFSIFLANCPLRPEHHIHAMMLMLKKYVTSQNMTQQASRKRMSENDDELVEEDEDVDLTTLQPVDGSFLIDQASEGSARATASQESDAMPNETPGEETNGYEALLSTNQDRLVTPND